MSNTNAFELKASLFTFTVLQLKTFDVQLIEAQLSATINKAPNFFKHAPVILDLHRLQMIACPIDFAGLMQILKAYDLIPMGVIGANPEQATQATCANLGILPGQYSTKLPTETTSTVSPPLPEHRTTVVASRDTTKIIEYPVRSGQQIYAKNSDLIVLAPVSQGAEIIADGHIHVYGALRGRALAGVSGDTQARIFCQKFEAELISIAGLYQLQEQFQSQSGKTQCQIYLREDKLYIDQLSL